MITSIMGGCLHYIGTPRQIPPPLGLILPLLSFCNIWYNLIGAAYSILRAQFKRRLDEEPCLRACYLQAMNASKLQACILRGANIYCLSCGKLHETCRSRSKVYVPVHFEYCRVQYIVTSWCRITTLLCLPPYVCHLSNQTCISNSYLQFINFMLWICITCLIRRN